MHKLFLIVHLFNSFLLITSIFFFLLQVISGVQRQVHFNFCTPLWDIHSKWNAILSVTWLSSWHGNCISLIALYYSSKHILFRGLHYPPVPRENHWQSQNRTHLCQKAQEANLKYLKTTKAQDLTCALGTEHHTQHKMAITLLGHQSARWVFSALKNGQRFAVIEWNNVQ
jgi:hypothetical protein